MMSDKVIADCNMLKISLQKSVNFILIRFAQEEMIKGLKCEKDYYQKQIECLRREVETLKTSL